MFEVVVKKVDVVAQRKLLLVAPSFDPSQASNTQA